MTIRYLPQDKIKELKEIINRNFPNKSRVIWKRIIEQMGSDNVGHDRYKNVERYREYTWEQFRKKEPETFEKVLYQRNLNGFGYTSENQVQEWFNDFLERNYKDEMSVISNDLNEILNWEVRQIIESYNVDPLYLHEILECEDLDELLNQKYSKKYVDAELLKRTEQIKKNIDTFFCDVPYNIFLDSLINYQNHNDIIKLHNCINRT